MTAGSLIVFEGAEGVGKTTQARRLVSALEQGGLACAYLREPGGTPLGEAVRKVLLEPSRTVTPTAEALLFMASRAQLVSEKILPQLASGSVVVLDRFFLSTYAYQIYGRGLPEREVRAANKLAIGDLRPSATIVLRLPGSEGLERAGARSGHDYMEQLGGDFHARVSAAFDEFGTEEWQAAHPECGPVADVDANGSADEVFERIVQAIIVQVPRLVSALNSAITREVVR